MVLLYKFDLDGVDVKNYTLSQTKIQLNRSGESGNTAEILLAPTVTAVKTPSAGQTIVISRGEVTSTDDYIFRGKVKRVEYNQESNHYVLKCKDKLQEMKYSLLNNSYDINIDPQAGEVSAIFADIVEDYGYDVSVVDSGTDSSDITINKFISKDQERLSRLNVLAKILNWFFYYDYNLDLVRLQPKGYTEYSTPLVFQTNVFNLPRWEEDLESVRNKIKVEGGFETDTRITEEIGDGSTATFYFPSRPESTYCTVDGTLQKQGVPNSTETYDYYIDKELKTYTFVTGSIPAIGEEIVMQYTTKEPISVTGKSTTSIAQYNVTQEAKYKFDDIQNVDDALTRLSQLLALLKDAPLSCDIFTNEYLIKPGMKVNFSNPDNGDYDGSYVVYGVTINYPEFTDVVKIGSERYNIQDLFTTINERLNYLEGSDSNAGDLLRHLIDLYITKYLKPKSFRLRKRSIGNAWIVGHPINGVVGWTVGEPSGMRFPISFPISFGGWSTEFEVTY